MTLRILFAAVVAAAAVTAGTASAAPSVLQNCGTIPAAGKTWSVGAAGIACTDAKAVVRKFAGKAVAVHVYGLLGTYLGLKCTGGRSPTGKPAKVAIACADRRGRYVAGFAR